MLGSTIPQDRPTPVYDEIRAHYNHLDTGCRLYGLTAKMFRAMRELFNIIALLFAVYLIEFSAASWEVAAGIAIVLVLGPAGIEEYLARKGVIAETDGEE